MPSIKVKVGSECNKSKMKPDRWNALLLTLWVSRLFGVAPVRFQKNIPGFPAIVCNALSRYSKLLMLFLHTVLLAGMVIDLQDGSYGVRVRGNWARFAFISEVFLIISINSIGAFGAHERLKRSIVYLNVIDKIKSNIEHPTSRKNTNISLIATIMNIVFALLLLSTDYYTFFSDSYRDNKDYKLMYFYVCFYAELMVVLLLELQFTWVAFAAHSGLKAINDAMEHLIYFIDVQRTSKLMTVEDLLDIDMSYIPCPVKPVNALVDRMTASQSEYAAPRGPQAANTSTSKYILESIRRLSISYGTVCDVIAGINDDFGSLLLLLIVSFVLHFVVTPFYFLNYWYSNKPRRLNLSVQIVWVFYHFTHLMLVVEPGFRTEQENEYTQTLTRQLLQRATSQQDLMLDELDIMLKHIDLNKVYYSPMGFCKLTRSLIKVIMGGATTYLVIILQFQRMVAGDW